eukprot:TsM_000622600 transcript=TsM_000622600 gene=TsM_000622600
MTREKTAPELLRNGTATLAGTKPGDIYAFDIIVHEVFYQAKPCDLDDTSGEEIVERAMSKGKPHLVHG